MPETFDQVAARLAAPDRGRSEADVQSDIRALLLAGEFLPSHHQPRLEVRVGSGGRIDIEFANLVIECKRDVGQAGSGTRRDHEQQLQRYLAERAEPGRGGNRLTCGLLTDGRSWLQYRLALDRSLVLCSETTVPPAGSETRAFREWLGSLLSTDYAVQASPQIVLARLGAGSPSHGLARSALGELLAAGSGNREVALKKRLWARLLAGAFGTQFPGSGPDQDLLFIEHTYLVLVAVLIARAALGLGADVPAAQQLSGTELADMGITGVGEAGFFDWPLSVAGGGEVVSDLMARVACFDWSSVDRDVLKVLYQSIVTPEVRHRLGEYYTPDWLADRVVSELFDDPLNQRLLDPACGSGTFLFAAVERFFDAARREGVPIEDALERLQKAVIGFDLHPVAVVLAQVTFMLAVGEPRLCHRRGTFSIPVYLADSMRWAQPPEPGGTLLAQDAQVVVPTVDDPGDVSSALRFPAEVVARPDFNFLVSEMVSKATDREPGSPRPPTEDVLAMLAPYTNDPQVTAALQDAFSTLCKLHDDEGDHIWGYFVRNQARPAWLSQHPVDVVVGNPPWLAYRYMPSSMQAAFRERCLARNLWVGGKTATQQDLSAFFVARSVELFLRQGGRFGFVVPLAVLSRQAYERFRSGRWAVGASAAFGTALSLEAVEPGPFPVPSAVVFGTKTDEQGSKPLPATVRNVSGRALAEARHWADAGLTESEGNVRATGDGPSSPYRDRFRQGATLVPRMLVFVEDAPTVHYQSAAQRSVRSRRSPQEKPPWKGLPSLSGVVEGRFVRPVLLGESVVPFAVAAVPEAIIPYSEGTGLVEPTRLSGTDHTGLRKWWAKANELWDRHKSEATRLNLLERLDYYGNLSCQFPIPKYRVVYTKAGNTLAAAVVADNRPIIDHKLYWAPVESLAEGRYLCAVLNAPCFNARVEPYQSRGAFGPRDFDKYVWALPVPLFDASEPLHQHLSELGQKAESVAAAVQAPSRGGFQAHRRAVREALASSGLASDLDDAVGRLIGAAGQ
jgi:hypothetical protein